MNLSKLSLAKAANQLVELFPFFYSYHLNLCRENRSRCTVLCGRKKFAWVYSTTLWNEPVWKEMQNLYLSLLFYQPKFSPCHMDRSVQDLISSSTTTSRLKSKWLKEGCGAGVMPWPHRNRNRVRVRDCFCISHNRPHRVRHASIHCPRGGHNNRINKVQQSLRCRRVQMKRVQKPVWQVRGLDVQMWNGQIPEEIKG